MAGIPSLLESAFSGWRNLGASVQEDFAKTQSLLHWPPLPTKPRPAKPRSEPEAAELARMVESEIIPRLMLAHRAPAPVVDPIVPLGDDATESFAQMVLSKESDSLTVFVGTLLQRGMAMETIYVDLLIPTARLLGDYWNADTISFTDVTIGLGRLQQVIRTLGWKIPAYDNEHNSAQSALFVSTKSEQHTFGLFIIEDFFRRAGWRTWTETAADDQQTVETVKCHWFDLFGLSASSDARTEAVKATIAAVRKASRNPDLFIMVGGRLFEEQPDLVALVGADATAASGADALLIADKALRRLPFAS